MNFFIVLACMMAAAQAQFGKQNFFGKSAFGASARAFNTVAKPVYHTVAKPVYQAAAPVARYVTDARNANILKYGNEILPDGSYSYFYETDNGIAAQEQGTPRSFGGNPPQTPVVAQGSFSWTSPEGEPIAISYVADENGYQPTGNAIPTSPPVPAAIARSLEYIARNAPRQ